jgi:phage terminase small subunit
MDQLKQRLRVVSPPAPEHLEAPERQLWDQLHQSFDLRDPAALALLTVAMESSARARRCRERIDADGEAVTDRFGQIRQHPLIPAERDAKSSFLSAMRSLNLDLTAVPK